MKTIFRLVTAALCAAFLPVAMAQNTQVLADASTGLLARPSTFLTNATNAAAIYGAIGLPSQTGNSGKVLGTNGSALSWVTGGGGGGGTWGSITGTLSNQTDLQAALDLKANLISPSFTTPTLGVSTATSIIGVAASDLTIMSGSGNQNVVINSTGTGVALFSTAASRSAAIKIDATPAASDALNVYRFNPPSGWDVGARINNQGAILTNAWITISGTQDFTPPSSDSTMLSVWSDVVGPTMVIRPLNNSGYNLAALDSGGNYRFSIGEDGSLGWGGIANPSHLTEDTTLSRPSAGVLAFSGSFTAASNSSITSSLSGYTFKTTSSAASTGGMQINGSGDSNLGLSINNTASGGAEWQIISSATSGVLGGSGLAFRDNTAALQRLTISGTGVVRATSSVASTSPSTGAFVLSGSNAGLGVPGSIYAGVAAVLTGSSANNRFVVANDTTGATRALQVTNSDQSVEYYGIQSTSSLSKITSLGTLSIGTGGGGTTALSIDTSQAITSTGSISPASNDGAALGTTTNQWSDLFLAEGAVINWDNGDATLTQVGDVVTLAGAELKISSPGNNSTSAVTTDGTQTLTNKTISLGSNTITSTSAQLAAALSDETGSGLAVFATNPVLLTPNAAVASNILDVTKRHNTQTLSGNVTWTLSATPSAGTIFGVDIVDDGTARTVTLPAGTWKSLTRGGTTITTITTVPNASYEISIRYDGTIYWMIGDPFNISMLTADAAPTSDDIVETYDITTSLPKKATLAAVVQAIMPAPGAIGATTPNAINATTIVAGSATSILTGTSGTAIGSVGFRNATSGTATLAPPTGALGTYQVTLPNAASTLPIYSQQITYSGPTSARTVTYPDASFTVARTDAANSFTTSTLSGAGAVPVTKAVSKLTSTGAAQAITLADGSDGQFLYIVHDVDGGSMVLTPTTKSGWSTATFTNAGETLSVLFTATRGWVVLGSYGAVVAP